MQYFFFHLMSWPHLPADFDGQYDSAWVWLPNSLYDPVKGHDVYREYLDTLGLKESGLGRLAHAAYDTLGLMTYLTAGEKEVRAWTIRRGTRAPQAAAAIHGDFERGFIKAEVIHWDDLLEIGSWSKARDVGKLRIEGKDYEVADGDVMEFRFNV